MYNNGDNITGGGTVLYKGNSTSYNHTSLIHSKYYHYKIYSINVNNEYSYGESKSVATLCGEIGFPIIEDFSDGFVPPCWENVDNDGSGQVWEFYEVGNFASSTAENGSAILDSDAYGSTGTQDADLITPIYDFSSYSEIYLSFIHTFKKYSSSLATLSYSVNGGTSWTVIDTWNTNTGTKEDPVAYFNDLSDKVAGYSEVVFKWNYVGAFEYHWIIDDIVITNDITKPDVVISSDESTETTVHPIPLTITFNEPVAGFELEDLSLTNATASNLNSISDSLYTVDIEPNQAGNIVVNISSGVAYDASGNINNAASEWSISFSYPVGINNFNETEFSVYPNPTNGILNLDIKNDYKTALIKVVDLTGKLIFIKEIEKTQNKINLSGLDKGMYILNIQIDNEVYNSQILIN